MRMNPLVIGFAVVALLYFVSERGGASSSTPSAPFGPTTPRPSDDGVAGGLGGDDWFLSLGARGEVCNLPDDRHTAWSDEQKTCAGNYHAGRAVSFRDMLWLPASRIPITSLTADDFTLATRFLANNCDRRGMPWTYAQSKTVNDWNDMGIVAFLRAVGPLIKAVTLGIVNSKYDAITDTGEQLVKDAALALGDLASLDDLAIATGPTPGTFDPTDPLEAVDPEKQRASSPFLNARGPSLDFGYDPIVFDSGPLYFRSRLFRASGVGTGWEYPWVCAELGYKGDGGDGSKATDKTTNPSIIAKQARLYRTLDVMGAMLRPFYTTAIYGAKPDADGNINVADVETRRDVPKGLHAYRIGSIELWGCVLPAADVDHPFDLSGTAQATRTIEATRDTTPSPTTQAQSTYTPPPPPPQTLTQSLAVAVGTTAPSSATTPPPATTSYTSRKTALLSRG